MKKRLLNCFLILTLMISMFTVTASAETQVDRSIIGDFFNKVFEIELTNGRSLLDTDQDAKNREELNNRIYNKTQNEVVSLYDRFGGIIKFVPYFGETKITTNLLDRFYTMLLSNESEFTLTVETIQKLFESPSISNNDIYRTRPSILGTDQIESGLIDSRVVAYSGISTTGGDASLGNLMLSISNFFTTIVAFISSGKMFVTINNLFIGLCDAGLTDLIQGLLNVFLPLAICIFVIMVTKKSFEVFKGSMAFKELLTQALSCIISLGIIFSFMNNPKGISNLLTQLTTLIDNVIDSSLQVDADEVVYSSNLENVRIATLWRISVFGPWCEGTFGDDYKNLYTHYDNDPNHTKMPQSNDNVLETWDDGSIRYNSVNLTGDVTVPICNGKTVRNWAALAWSCQSIYHIDATNSEENHGIILSDSENWPKASITPKNNQIYVDNFRWLDAMLNISPEYRSPEAIIQSYSNCNRYKQNFVGAGARSLWLTLMLLPIGILSIRKLKESLLLILSSVRMIYHSVMGFIIPDQYNILDNIKKIGKQLYEYLWWSIMVFVSINLYTVLMNKNLIADILWICIGLYLNKFKPVRTSRRVQEIGKGIVNGAKDFKKRVFG